MDRPAPKCAYQFSRFGGANVLPLRRSQVVICVICGLIAALAVFAYCASVNSAALTQRNEALKRYGGEQACVMVAARDIEAGHVVEKRDVKSVTWLVDLLPEASVATKATQAVGKVAQTAMKKGEPLVLFRLGTENARISVPTGLEAVSVSSDDVLAVGGAIKAGSRVDVYVEGSSEEVTLLGRDILVVETSAAEENSNSSLTWVTLAVTKDSVEDLLSAAVQGTVHLALPGTQDDGGE